MRNYQREQLFARRLLGMKREKKVTNSYKYFLNLEFHRKGKSSVRKVFKKEKLLVTDYQKILGLLEGFYSGLYKKDDIKPSENLMNTFLRILSCLDLPLTILECVKGS